MGLADFEAGVALELAGREYASLCGALGLLKLKLGVLAGCMGVLVGRIGSWGRCFSRSAFASNTLSR